MMCREITKEPVRRGSSKRSIFVFAAFALFIVLFSVFMSAQSFVQEPHYFHWVDPSIDVDETYNKSRIFNLTGPLLATAYEDSIWSDDLGLAGADYDFYLTPRLPADVNISGVQTFSLWMRISFPVNNRDQVSVKTEMLDFNTDTGTYTSLGTSSITRVDATTYTEYLYNISVEDIVSKGHRLVARVHPFESLNAGLGPRRRVTWYFAYDSSTYDSYLNLSKENVYIFVNVTEPENEMYSAPQSVFNLTCNVSCNYGVCRNVTVYPQYCTGLSCSSFANMDNETGGLVVSEVSYFWDEVGNQEEVSRRFEITSRTNNHYRVRCNATATNVFQNQSAVMANVSVSELNQTGLDHENEEIYMINEYEAGDVIGWINATVSADNNATSSNVSVNILDSLSLSAGWGPDEVFSCGLVENQSTCVAEYTNISNGYTIPDNVQSGMYLWNVTSVWLGGFKENTSNSFSVYNLVQDNFSSAVNVIKITVNESVEYNFTMENPWSENLTLVNVTINCPAVSGILCNCSLAGQEAQTDYCYLGDVTGHAARTALFYIATDSSTPVGLYDINVTVSYVNPGNTSHTRNSVQNREITIVAAGLFASIYSSPAEFTRGDSFGLKGYVTNKNTTEETNVTLNWSFPAYWTNQTGNLNNSFGSMPSGETNWSNITVSTTILAATGTQTAYIYANSSSLFGDSHSVAVDVYANTQILNTQANDTDPEHGDMVKFTARLRYDNNTIITGKTLSFFDETDNIEMGSNVTDDSGYVYLYYPVPSNATVGTHTINITFGGSGLYYLNPKSAEVTMSVHDYPVISDVSISPSVLGYGYNVTVSANISDEDGIDSVCLYVTDPRTGSSCIDMSDIGGGMFSVNYTAWHYGEYQYYVWTNDSFGNLNDTSGIIRNFHVRSNITLRSVTDFLSYGSNAEAYINNSYWWNSSWNYRVRIDANSTSEETDVLLSHVFDFTTLLDYAGSVMQVFDINSVRVIEWNDTSKTNTEIDSNKSYIDIGGADLWDEDADKPSPVDFSSGLNSTANTFGLGGIDDGWDWDEGTYGSTGDITTYIVSHYDPDSLSGGYVDGYVEVMVGGPGTRNHEIMDSGSWGIMFYIDDPMYLAIQEGASANVSFDYIVENLNTLEEPSWIKARFTTSVGTYYLGYDCDGADSDADATLDVWCNVSGLVFSGTTSTFSEDVSSYITGTGWHYLDFGIRVDWRGYTKARNEGLAVYFDNVSFVTFAVTYDNLTNAELNVSWVMNGTTPANTTRDYYVYFDIAENGEKQDPSYPAISGSSAAGTLAMTEYNAEIKETKVQNTGNISSMFYFFAKVQKYDSGSWADVGFPVINYPATGKVMSVSADSIVYMNPNWTGEGGWNTLLRTPGTYRLYTALMDDNFPSALTLKDQEGNSLVSTHNFTIFSADVEFVNLVHDHQYFYSVNEYETGDYILWVNQTHISHESIAPDTNVTLNILDESNNAAGFGPSEIVNCGDVQAGAYCYSNYTNSSNHYLIPVDSTDGTKITYTYIWNSTAVWSPGGFDANTSQTFLLHHVPYGFSSTPLVRVMKNDSVIYNFTMENPWSGNLTSVNVTINCPAVSGIFCNCSLAGQEAQIGYCNLGNITNMTNKTASFNIAVNLSVSVGDYDVDVNVTYINPAQYGHTWYNEENRKLLVREPYLEVNITNSISVVVRNITVFPNGSVTNVGAPDSNNLWLNWTFPSNWTNVTGDIEKYIGTLTSGNISWNNLTVNISIDEEPGPVEIKLKAEDDNSIDWHTVYATIYAGTSLTLTANATTATKGEAILLTAHIAYDNGTALSSANITFNDNTQFSDLGWDVSNNTGYSSLIYVVPSDAVLGNHTINATYAGSSLSYYYSSYSLLNITIRDMPMITDVSVLPQVTGYGQNITLSANVTDGDGVDTVKVKVIYPNSTYFWAAMSNNTQDIFEYNFTDIQTLGTYSFYVWANNTYNIVNTTESTSQQFSVSVNATVFISPHNDTYLSNTYVNITNKSSDWWNELWLYRKLLNITEPGVSDRVNWTVDSFIDTEGHADNCTRELRVVDSTLAEVPIYVYSETYSEGKCQSANFTFLSDVSSSSYSEYYVYYGNSLASQPSYPVWSVNCSSNSSLCATMYYSRHDISAGLDSRVGEIQILDADESAVSRQLAFDIGYFSNSYTTSDNVYVHDNGFFDFLSSTADSTPSQSEFVSRYISAVLWDDYDPTRKADGGAVYENVFSDRVVWTWDTATDDAGHDVTLQAVLYDTGDIMFRYGTVEGFQEAGHLAGISAGDNVHYLNNPHGDNYNTAFYQYYKAAGTFAAQNEEQSGYDPNYSSSKIYNTGLTNITGSVLLEVDRYLDDAWQTVDVIYNQVTTIAAQSIFDLYAIWNPVSWDVEKSPRGIYRVYAAFTDALGNVFKDDSGQNIEASGNFTVVWPIVLNFEDIVIYDVTGAANPKTNTINLVDSGLNKTFNLCEYKKYRVEIKINNSLDSTKGWIIDDTVSIMFKSHNASWMINESQEIWYRNQTDEFTGGFWNGDVEWNTSLGGVLELSDNMTFYYILNVTSGTTGIYPVDFEINNTDFVVNEYSTYNVLVEEFDPPTIVDDVYLLNTSLIHRGDSVLVYAHWNENITSASVEYNSTTASFSNYSLSPADTWTNYTVLTDPDWLLGDHWIKIYASDIFGNDNNTLPYLIFDVWGWSYIQDSDIVLSKSTIYAGSDTLILCRVTADDNTSIYNYNVSFYNSTSFIGYNLTNITGWAVYNYTDYTPGIENLTCNITDDASKKFNASFVNGQTIQLTTYETACPLWYEPFGINVTGIVHKTDSVLVYANWTDNFELDYAWLSSNETGAWQNNSLLDPVYLDKAEQNWSNFSFAMPTSMNPAYISLRIYANDTSGNINVTDTIMLDVWGWSSISDSDLDPSVMYNGSTTVFSCKVVDNSSSLPIEDYTVEFWNSTNIIGYNVTESNGWAHMSYTDESIDTENMWCYIYDNETLKYNITSADTGTKILYTALEGSDIVPPQAIIYDMNATYVKKGQGESIIIYALWNESINASDGSFVTYNSTSSQLVSSATDIISDSWTNHTFNVDSNWIVGLHTAKLNASDNFGNWNNTLEFLEFDVYGYAKIDWSYESSLIVRKGDELVIGCNVTDNDNSLPVDRYTVVFKNSTSDIGSNNSVVDGSATMVVDTAGYDVGPETFTCYIYDDDEDTYYFAAASPLDSSSRAINFTADLNVSVTSPPNNSIVTKSQAIDLNSTTIDNLGNPIVPSAVNWYNDSVDLIGSSENITHNITLDTPVGLNVFKVNVSKECYTSDESYLYLYVYGYSNVSWNSLTFGTGYGQIYIATLNCSVTDNATNKNIYNHTVSFYVENSTGSYFLGTNETDLNGSAVMEWDTSVYSVGTYYPKCNVTDDADVYYYASQNNESNSTFNLTETGSLINATLVTPPNGTMVGQNRTFTVNATVNCSGSCGTVYGTVLSDGIAVPSDSGTPFFTVGSNTKICSENTLNNSDVCYVNWTLNVTGDLNSLYNISVKFDSSVTPENFTGNNTVEIGVLIIAYLNFSVVDFDVLIPTDTDKPALNNGGYGFFIGENSNNVDGVWIRGTNLTITPFTPATNCGGNLSCDNNRIPVWSVAWSKTSHQDRDLQEYYEDLDGTTQTVPSGWNTTLYFWMDVPKSKLSGAYNGTLIVMTNASY